MRTVLIASALFAVSLATTTTAHAADAWVDRADTLPRGDFAFDVGLGLAHDGQFNPSVTGAGLNFDFGVGITQRIELGFRTGVGFGDDGQFVRADAAGRIFDRETFDTGNSPFSNPEVRLRGALYRGDVAEVALEGRVVVPFADGTRLGAMFGVPLAFHGAGRIRVDTGVFIPVVFDDTTAFGIDVPVDVWFQITRKLWLGPETGVYYRTQGAYNETDIPIGFGLGISLTRAIDFKAQAMFPAINHDGGGNYFTTGGAFEFRIE